MNDEVQNIVGSLIDQLQDTNQRAEKIKTERNPLKKEDLEKFVIERGGELIEDALEMVATVKDFIISAPNAEDVDALAGLINATSAAMDTLNKINIADKKTDTSVKLKTMDIESKKELLQADNTQTTGVKWATLSVSPVFPSTAVSSNISLVSGNNYMVDTSAARTLTLPASASLGDEIHIFDATGSAFTNNITVNNNGLNLRGSNQTLTINVNYAAVVLIYVGATYGWRVS